ncbi:PAS domain-containing protein [Flavobacterium sp. K5-23]|uniref:PAS domain-containing protein n=1 Tax=Flavobacterium sp. K5-23 TaxID=2746225 RepID=UPI00200FAE1A|nr:PAS domain-containing protein [Flavobacterium sp. K5-23]UQD57109.1 PAS domain-containing protein [Flavobacterium sp. K5-23]
MVSKSNWSNFTSWFLTKPKTTGLLVFLILWIVVTFAVLQRYQVVKENEHIQMNSTLKVVQQNIEQSLRNSNTTALSLALTINDNGIPEDFEYYGKQLLESNHSIDVVQLVPKGIIKYIYPLSGNEAALNFNILKSPLHKKEAIKSIENQKMYFAGPLQLKQGGIGIVGRLPVYKKNVFWGFSGVVIKLETLLKNSGINEIDNSKYFFQFAKKNPLTLQEDFFLPAKTDFADNHYVSGMIPDGDWKIYLVSNNQYYLYSQVLPSAILGFILAILFGFFITVLLKKPAELQLLVNQQATKLLNSEIKFKTIFDNAAVGIAHVDTDSGKYIEINNQYCKLLEYSSQEMKLKNFQSLTHPEDLELDSMNFDKLKKGTINEIKVEKRYFTKSGGTVWVNLMVSPLWKTSKSPATHISVIENITQRKESEELLKKSKIRFKSLFENSPIPLSEQDFSSVKRYLLELNLINESTEKVVAYLNEYPEVVKECISLIKVIDVNFECIQLYKIKHKEALIDNPNLLFEFESDSDFIKLLVAITQGKTQFNVDTRILNTDGEYHDINLRWNVIKGYEKSLDRIIISTIDITANKISEKIILDSQKRTESIINTVDGIVWEFDIESSSFTFISKKVEEILGYPSEEWIADSNFWRDHLHPDDQEWAINYCDEKTNGNSNFDFEYRMINKEGNIVWLKDIVNIVFENKKPKSLRGIMIDITKAKEIENDLNNSFNLVTEQNKRLLNFSYIVSHNLRSHTSNIESITNLIETSETKEERDQMIQLLKTVSDSLNETMYNLNEVINIQANIGLISESLNLKRYIDNTKTVLSEQIASKDASIISTITSDVEINYNPAYLESILLNLISNALRYRHPDRKPVIAITYYQENDKNVIQVSDNGIGIDLIKNGDKIFGMYKTFSNNPESRGIGLFITKNQIDAMGGKITVKSELNIGTTFKIYII